MYSREKVIEKYKQCGALLDVLNAVQEAEGYLSPDALEDVAAAYGRYPSEIYETATFYSMLEVGQRAEHTIGVCGSTCCDTGGAKAVMDAVCGELGIRMGEVTEDRKWFFTRLECLGCCDTAPNVMIDGVLITSATVEKVIEAIRKAGK